MLGISSEAFSIEKTNKQTWCTTMEWFKRIIVIRLCWHGKIFQAHLKKKIEVKEQWFLKDRNLRRWALHLFESTDWKEFPRPGAEKLNFELKRGKWAFEDAQVVRIHRAEYHRRKSNQEKEHQKSAKGPDQDSYAEKTSLSACKDKLVWGNWLRLGENKNPSKKIKVIPRVQKIVEWHSSRTMGYLIVYVGVFYHSSERNASQSTDLISTNKLKRPRRIKLFVNNLTKY